jgi:hypothetical protein
MLDTYFEDNAATGSTLYAEVSIICDMCDKEALIFQNDGNFCLKCWQDRTEPNIS